MMMQTPQWQLLLKGKQHAKNATNTRGPNGGAVHVNTQPAQVVYAFCVSSAVGDDDDDDNDDSIFVASPACGGERSPSPLAVMLVRASREQACVGVSAALTFCCC